jgi:hypothetical protein
MIERMKYPDNKNAKSILEASLRQMNYTLKLESNDDSAFNIIRNIYECFRMLGDALLVTLGQISEDHVEQVKALENLNVKLDRPLQIVDNLRRMRHNINYYGFSPKKIDGDDALSFAKSCFFRLAEAVSKKIK